MVPISSRRGADPRGAFSAEEPPAGAAPISHSGARACAGRRDHPSGEGPPPHPGRSRARAAHGREPRRAAADCQGPGEWLDSPRRLVLLHCPGRSRSSHSGPREATMAQVIGFIGLGIMGRPMAKNLLKAGYPLIVHRRSQGPVPEVGGAGAKPAPWPRDVAAQCDVLITMLPNSPDVELVALGKDGIIEGARRDLLFLDMSTLSPPVAQKVGRALAAKGVRMLDAPVSGGEKGAIDGALSIMVGGEKADFDARLPVFQAMGKTITHLGPLGAGGFTKLANQIIVAVNLTALGEALTLARKAGLDRELTLKALGGGLAGSKCLEQKTANYVSGSYKPGFKIDLHFKDLGLIMESSRALGVPLPATAVVQELFNAMRVKGQGGLDHSGVITLLEELAGVPEKS